MPLWTSIDLQPHHLPQLFLGLPLLLVKRMSVNIQRRTGLGVPQQAGHGADIHALGDQQAGVCVPLRYNKDKRKNPVFSRVSAFVVAYSIPFPTLIANEKSVE